MFSDDGVPVYQSQAPGLELYDIMLLFLEAGTCNAPNSQSLSLAGWSFEYRALITRLMSASSQGLSWCSFSAAARKMKCGAIEAELIH